VPLVLLSIGRMPAAADLAGIAMAHTAATAAEVDAALAQLDGSRLIIDTAELAGLNLVLARLLRAGRLAEVETAVLLDRPVRYLAGLGLPADRAGQLALAHTGSSRLVGIVRDDSGDVCVSDARLTAWQPAEPWWARAVVDDLPLCDGLVRSVTMRRIGPSELIAEARIGRFRVRRQRGRALQLACDPAQIVADGVGRERPRRKRTFWSEPALWRLALPPAR
jgi:hypothetical protein